MTPCSSGARLKPQNWAAFDLSAGKRVKRRLRHRRTREGPAMRPRGAGRFWHWIRSNIFDGWQVAGTLGLLIGASLVVALVMNAKHRLPMTNAAIKLVQTVGSQAQEMVPEPSASPSPEPSASPSASPSSDQSGGAVSQAQPAAKPTTSRSVRRAGPTATTQPAPPSSPPPTPLPTPPPTPKPGPTLPVPCLPKC